MQTSLFRRSWLWYLRVFKYPLELFPGVAVALTPAIEPLLCILYDPAVIRPYAACVAMYIIIIVMAYQLALESVKELFLGQVPGRFEPCLHPLQRYALLGRRRTALGTSDTFPIFVPVKFKSQEREGSATLATGMKAAEAYDLRFARLQLQFKAAKPLGKNVVKPSGVIPVLKGAHPIICVPAHDGAALQPGFDHILEPFIQHYMQIKIR